MERYTDSTFGIVLECESIHISVSVHHNLSPELFCSIGPCTKGAWWWAWRICIGSITKAERLNNFQRVTGGQWCGGGKGSPSLSYSEVDDLCPIALRFTLIEVKSRYQKATLAKPMESYLCDEKKPFY